MSSLQALNPRYLNRISELFREYHNLFSLLPGEASEFQHQEYGLSWYCYCRTGDSRLMFSLHDGPRCSAQLAFLARTGGTLRLPLDDLDAGHERTLGYLTGESVAALERAAEFFRTLEQLKTALGPRIHWLSDSDPVPGH